MNNNSIYFLVCSILMLVLAVFGFGGNALFYDSLSQVSNWVLLHGLIMFSWLIWMCIQSFLVRNRKGRLPKAWFSWNVLLAPLVLLSLVLVTIFAFQSGKKTLEDLTFNLFVCLNFVILFRATMKNDSLGGEYERYMVMTNLAIIFPALKRISGFLNQGAELALVFLACLLMGVFVYELRVLNRITKVSWLGLVLIVFGVICTAVLPGLQFWEALINQLLL
ncbi:MAG: hypothetical protein P8P48_07620 [Saprospiraceae bacterium]|nr:hypothetical protein [Saprospiraceae bacterium]